MATQERTQILQARMKPENKNIIVKAAKLRDIPTSDYIRSVLLEHARKEVQSAENEVLQLTADEQLTFWSALDRATPLTTAQIDLGKLMRGEV